MLVASKPPYAAHVLSALEFLTYGGAALAPHCPDVFRKHGITVMCTYGQTELGGPVLFGIPGGDPNALLPLRGVRYELVRSESDASNEGELVLLGNRSSTMGYLGHPTEATPHRSLCGSSSPLDRMRTNDRFRKVNANGKEML
eukprot:2246703-Prymnesium_polylepis.1